MTVIALMHIRAGVDFVLGYVAGLLTLINPCVLPILPIVLATALQAGRAGPLAVAAGLSVVFVTLGMAFSVLGQSQYFNEGTIAKFSAVMMIGFGLVLLVPRLSERFATATAGVSARADMQIDNTDRTSLQGQFLGGALLGAVWSPCIGPTLGGAISLANSGDGILQAFFIMVAFALGVSTIILALGYGAQSVIRDRQAWMRNFASAARPIMGGVFVAVGLAIFLNLHKMIEIWALDTLPEWFLNLSISI